MTKKNTRHNGENTNSELVGRLENGTRCHSCAQRAVIPVKDRNLSETSSRGNPYRLVCVSCGKSVRMTKREEWEHHQDRCVIRVGESIPVPVFDCPECDDLVEGQADKCPNCGTVYEW